MAESNLFWNQLLELIEEGRVVPIVGRELLAVSHDGSQIDFYQLLARRLADYLGVTPEDLPAGSELNEVACRFLAEGNDIEELYPALKSVMSAEDELPVPEPLVQLAELLPLKLFVSTTLDPLLARAIDQVRFGGASRTRIISYAPTDPQDLPSEIDSLDTPVVFHLLGRISAVPFHAAVTQEDILEFVHSLQMETRRPKRLFGELSRGSLLILGSSFGGWLARFFLRTTKSERLLSARGTDYLADERVRGDDNLILFLEHFSSRTKVIKGVSAIEFVSELSRHWRERHPATEKPAADELSTPTTETRAGAVFLSYASEDREAVESIKDSLEEDGIDVFFDKDDLEGGDAFDERLMRSIGECALFVPVISRHTLTRQRRFFRQEWRKALEEAQRTSFGEHFIVPLLIDDTPIDKANVPPLFRDLQWCRAPGGQATREFVALVKKGFRGYHKATTRTV